MSHQIFLLTRASGAETNAAQFGDLAIKVASTAAAFFFTLPMMKECGAIHDYLHRDEAAGPGNTHLTLFRVLGAFPETAVLPGHGTVAKVVVVVPGRGVNCTLAEFTGLGISSAVIRTHAHRHRRLGTGIAVHGCGARPGEVVTMHAPTELAGAR